MLGRCSVATHCAHFFPAQMASEWGPTQAEDPCAGRPRWQLRNDKALIPRHPILPCTSQSMHTDVSEQNKGTSQPAI